MKVWWLGSTLIFIGSIVALAAEALPPTSDAVGAGHLPRNVILVTWDGVRQEEINGLPDPTLAPDDQEPIFPYLRDTLRPLGQLYGVAGEADMVVANTTFVSLPAYHSIFSGRLPNCFNNDCGRTGDRTFMETLVTRDGLPRHDVASLSSWEKLPFAAERQSGTALVNGGTAALDDGTGDGEMRRLNAEQARDTPPWEGARFDRYTQAQALRYLKAHQPRFLHIGLNDADEHGHRGDYPAYVAALRRYDQWLAELVATLADLGDYGANTCLLVTTDHGRGIGGDWTRHSNGHMSAGRVFLFAACPGAAGTVSFDPNPRWLSHLDLRPTIEDLLGVQPQRCLECGRSLLR